MRVSQLEQRLIHKLLSYGLRLEDLLSDIVIIVGDRKYKYVGDGVVEIIGTKYKENLNTKYISGFESESESESESDNDSISIKLTPAMLHHYRNIGFEFGTQLARLVLEKDRFILKHY